MNKCFRLIWNDATNTWVAVSEIVKARSKRSGGNVAAVATVATTVGQSARFILKAITTSLLFAGLAHAAPPANELPTNGQVTAGSASISQSGSTMTIQQTTDRAAVNWNTFNVGSGATVNIQQPGASSVLLNRVMSNNPSQIFGQINANGQVFLSNPSGVYFAPGSSVNVGGIVATTHKITDADFMAGINKFNRDGATGSVINEGDITAAINGYVALMAPEVRNNGVIIAQLGTVALAAGEAYELQFDNNNTLTNIRVEPATIAALVENGNAVQAPGGLILLSAQAVNSLQGGIINNSGTLEASSLTSKGGRIILEGDSITLKTGSSIKATGATGGGEVLVGGDWQGSGTMHQATTVIMEAGATIDASATQNGDGGKVVLWSDIHNADSLTKAHGAIKATGGANSGDGGKIETSGHSIDTSGININAGTTNGKSGLWLIDPYDYTIDATAAGNIATALNTTNVTVTTISNAPSYGSNGNSASNGDITVASSISKTAGGDTTLTLQAARHISLQSGATITSSVGKLNLQLWADSDNNGDGIILNASTNINTNGGWLKFGNNITANLNRQNVLVGGDVFFQSGSAQTLNTGGGAIDIYGETIVANAAGLTLNSGGGNITLHGLLNSGNQYTWVDKTGSSGSGTWDAARAEANGGTSGVSASSYLVNITSRLENSIAGLTAGNRGAWIGAYRPDTNSYAWKWADGPESGQTFYTQGIGTAAGYYSNFGSGEPNGGLNATRTSVESVGQFFGTAGQWNDLNVTWTYSATQTDPYRVLGFVRETNLAASPVTINAGSGNVLLSANVGTAKAIKSLSITANEATLPSAITTQDIQTYNAKVKLPNHTTLTTTNSDIIFNGTVDSVNAADPKNLTTNILAGTTYYWVNWTSADATHVYGTITIGGKTINVTFTKPVGFNAAVTNDAATNFWTGYSGAAFTGGISPYTSSLVQNGPTGGDIIQLSTGGAQTLTFSESIENLAFSVVSMNGGDFAFNQNFTIESYTGYNAGLGVAGSGYFGGGNMNKTIVGGTYKLTAGSTNGSSVGGNIEPHGTIRFNNAFSELTWVDVTETWHGFTIGTSGASADAGKVQFNGIVGGVAKVGDIDINGAMQTTANISSANSLDVSGFSNIGANITTALTQNYQSAINLTNNATLTTTANGSVVTNATVNGAYNLTINTNGSGDTTIGGAIGATTALKNLSITTDDVSLNGINVQNNSAITIANTGASAISTAISGTGVTLSKAGVGTLTLNGINTYTGATTISDGILKAGDNGAFGTGLVTVNSGGAADLNGKTIANNFNISGTGVSDSGAIYNSSSTAQTISGAITLAGDSTIKSTAGGALTISGAINGAHGVTIDTNGVTDGAFIQSGIVGGTTPLASYTVISDTAAVTLSGAVNTTGAINVSGGNINLNANLNTTAGGVNGDILLKGSGDITLAAGKSLTTTGGDVILWANSDGGTTNGGVFFDASGSVSTSGGHIWVGGGSGTTTWNGLSVGNGFAVSGKNLSSFGQLRSTIDWEAGIFLDQTTLSSAGGNIYMAGKRNATVNNKFGAGFINYSGTGTTVDAGAGTITIIGESADVAGYADFGVMTGLHPKDYTGVFTLKSSNTTDATAISITGSTASAEDGILIEDHTRILSTASANGGGISIIGSTTGARNALSVGIGTNNGTLDVLSASGEITIDVGSDPLLVATNGIFKLGSISGDAAVSSSSANVTIISDSLSWTSGVPVRTSGHLTVKSSSASFATDFNTNGLNYTGITGLTIGKLGNTRNVTVGSVTSVAGPISIYGGNIAIDAALTATGSNTISLTGTGTITDGASGYVVADKLALLGGNVTLDHASNNIGTLAASGVSGLSYVGSNALTIGTVGAIGITATGAVSISTLTGDLDVTESITTTNTTADAVILNAGKTAAAGTAAGGNILVTSGKTVTVGAGGTAKLYSGSVSGSTGLTTMVGSGSGRFRYNSDETTTNFTNSGATALSTGLNAIYREQPTTSATVDNQTIIYGNAIPTVTGTTTGTLNGDTATYGVSNALYSTANKIKAGSYTLTATGLADLGYNVSGGSNGTLTVSAKALSLSGFDAANKTYDGNTTATINNAGSLSGLETNDIVSVSNTGATFDNKNFGTGKMVTLNGVALASGNGNADAANYSIASTATDTANIGKAAATVTANSGTVTYNGLTQSISGFTATGLVGGETTSVLTGVSEAGGSGKNVGSYSHSASGTDTNYTLTFVDGSLDIGKAAATVTANSGTVTYNGLTQSISGFTATGLVGGETTSVLTGVSEAGGSGKNVGSYSHSASGTDTNYTLTFVDGSLDIGKAAATVTANSGTVTYNGLTQSISGFTASGLVNSETIAVLDSVTTSGGSGTNAGSYSHTASGTDENYNLSFSAGTLLITPKTVSLSATKIYDGTTAMGANTVSISGLVGIETLNYSSATANSKDVLFASYINAITLGNGANGGLAANYQLPNLTSANAGNSATVTPKALTVSGASAENKVYNGNTQATVTVDNLIGLANGESLTLSSVGNFVDANVGTGKTVNIQFALADIGSYLASNYTISDATTTADINPQANVVPPPPAVPGGESTGAGSTGVNPAEGGEPIGGSGLTGGETSGGDTSGGETSSSDGTPSTEAANNASTNNDVEVKLKITPSITTDGLVTALIAKSLIASGAAFSIPLPKANIADDKARDIIVTLLDGNPLPAWMTYNKRKQAIEVKAVPANGLPIKVLVVSGGKHTMIEITAKNH